MIGVYSYDEVKFIKVQRGLAAWKIGADPLVAQLCGITKEESVTPVEYDTLTTRHDHHSSCKCSFVKIIIQIDYYRIFY